MKTPTIPVLFYPTISDWNSVYSQKVESMTREMWKKNEIGSCAKTCFKRKQKFGQLGWSEWFYFMKHIYHKEVGEAELG